MNSKIQNAINEQINAEMFSANLYLSMSAHFGSQSLNGFANWMNMQYQEEMIHAMKFLNFIIEQGGKVEIKAIEAPQTDFNSSLEIFELALEHERKVSALINDLYTLALEEKDYASQSFLKWFIDEQIEEEASASEMIDRIKLAGNNNSVLLMLDNEAKTRTLEPGE